MIIQLTNINKYYYSKDQKVFALKAINLEVIEGEFLIIKGPSGSGKSTLLNIMGFLDKPSAGVYSLLGQCVFGSKDEPMTDFRQNCIGFIPQANRLIEEMTVLENIGESLKKIGMKIQDHQKLVSELLERLNLASKKDLFPGQLSYGQQRCVAIARAVVTDPKLILADEPISYLDPISRLEIINLLTELNQKGTTIVMATHTPGDAYIADRSINLFNGQIVSEKIKASVNETCPLRPLKFALGMQSL